MTQHGEVECRVRVEDIGDFEGLARDDGAADVEAELRAAGWEVGTDPVGAAPPPYRRAWAIKGMNGCTLTVRSGWEETLVAALDRIRGMCNLVDGVL
jgi:hypothetical protein